MLFTIAVKPVAISSMVVLAILSLVGSSAASGHDNRAGHAFSLPGDSDSGDDSLPGPDGSDREVGGIRTALALERTVPGHGDDRDDGDPVGGRHWRLETRRGPVHVWIPDGYLPETAGIVVYVHGYRIDVDTAWTEHFLATQFRDSGRNALFIVPEAPANVHRSRKWRRLHRLIRTVLEETELSRPRGELVAVGHSGAYRTLLSWLRYRKLHTVVLLDALYGVEKPFAAWLRRGSRSKRIINIAERTQEWSEDLARRVRSSVTFDSVPDAPEEILPETSDASLVYMRAQYEHMEIVTSGAVIPLALALTDLEATTP